MKVITLLSPWAQLMAIEAKKIETRSWATKYRGPMAIHVSKSTRPWHMNLGHKEPFWSALKTFHSPTGGLKCHNGNIIAVGNLVDCIEIAEPVFGLIALYGETETYVVDVKDNEYAFGDYTPGRFAWIFQDVKMLREPIPAKGRLGIWEYDGEITA